MNERIRELSYEAQRYALNNTTGPDLAGLNELWQEKFAELIVRECLRACSKANEIRYPVPPTKGQVVVSCMREIEEHFGVEEDQEDTDSACQLCGEDGGTTCGMPGCQY